MPENKGEIKEDEIVELEIEEFDPITDLNTPRGSSNKLKPEEIPFNLEKEQEKTRGRLANILAVSLAVSLLISFMFIFTSDLKEESKKELITLIWTSQVTLVGTALGFYFGRK